MSPTVPGAASRKDEAGFALATAMFALAVIGALVAGSFLPGRLEQQSGYNVTYAGQALEAAEAGLAETVAALEAPALEPLVPGGIALDLGTATVGEMITVHTSVARLTSRVFIVKSQGTRHDASGGARRNPYPRSLRSARNICRRNTGRRCVAHGGPAGGAELGAALLSTATCCTAPLEPVLLHPERRLAKEKMQARTRQRSRHQCPR